MNNYTKIKFGGGLNLLCIAASVFLTAKAVIEIDKWQERKEEQKRLKEACEAVEKINEIIDKLDAKKVGYPDKNKHTLRVDALNIRDVLFDDCQNARSVLEQLQNMVNEQGYATVAYFAALAGLDSNFTDDYMGWMKLEDVKIFENQDGDYYIDLPKPVELNKE